MRASGRAKLVAAVALTALVAQGGPAEAATVLRSGQWVTPHGPQPATADFTVRTTGPYWSVALLRPGYIQASSEDQIPEYDLELRGGTSVLAGSAYRDAVPDFVAIDGNIRAPQSYTARVVRLADNNPGEQYGLTFANGGAVLPSGHSTITAPAGAQPNNVYVRDLYLSKGTIASVTVGGVNTTCPTAIGTLYLHTWLLASDPQNPVQGRASALAHASDVHQNGTTCATRVSAMISRTGWYGLVIFDPAFRQLSVDLDTTSTVIS